MNTLNRLARFAGVLILLVVGVVSSQVVRPDTMKIGGILLGPDLKPLEPGSNSTRAIATSDPGSRGGGVYLTSTMFYFGNLSYYWCGKIHIEATLSFVGGFTYDPSDIIVKGLIKSTTYTIAVTDIAKPGFNFEELLSNNILTVNKPHSINLRVWDNSGWLRSIQYDYSLDSGKTWDTISSLRKTIPKYIDVDDDGDGFDSHPQSTIFTPKKACDSCIIRVILIDYWGNSTTKYVPVKVQSATRVYPNIAYRAIKAVDQIMIYDLSGRKISGIKKTTNFYVVKTNSLVHARLNPR